MKAFKVFGVGLNKTGTSTLGVCLQSLGYRHLSLRADLLAKFRLGHIEDVYAVIDEFESFEDWPYPLMYRELYDRYGDDARFILTTRIDPDTWFESLKSHSLRSDPNRHCRQLAYGFPYPHGLMKEHVAIYERHNAGVRRFFADKQKASLLLDVCWERGDGWNELCRFLDHPVPSIPFPHENRKPQQQADTAARRDNVEALRRHLSLLRLDLNEAEINRLLECEVAEPAR